MRKALHIIIPIIVCFAVGATASYFQQDAIETWYPYLNKPALTPPNIAFPIAWSIIYVCIGLSIGLIWNTTSYQKRFMTILFCVQLFFNFTWSISFFYLQNPLLGFINILILDVLVIYYIIKAYPVSKASSMLFVPYVLWIIFATYLNGYILVNN